MKQEWEQPKDMWDESQPPAHSSLAKVAPGDADPAQCPANLPRAVARTRLRDGPGHFLSEEH